MISKEENRVVIECSDTSKKIKAFIIEKNDIDLKVEMPTGYVLDLKRKHKKGPYTLMIGQLEFMSDGLTYP
jgi:hypothetical protein